MGRSLSVTRKPKGVKLEISDEIKFLHTAVNATKSVETALIEQQITSSVSATLAAKLAIPNVVEVTPSLKSDLSAALKKSFSTSLAIERTVTDQREVRHTVKRELAEGMTETVLAVEVYQRYALDLYVEYIDYLFVDYSRSLFGLRKKRRKWPVSFPGRPNNVIRLGTQVATAHFWRLAPDQVYLVTEAEYRDEVTDPTRVHIKEAVGDQCRVEIRKPSLYQLAHVAFPLKWREPKGPWTTDDLARLEVDEAREHEGSFFIIPSNR